MKRGLLTLALYAGLGLHTPAASNEAAAPPPAKPLTDEEREQALRDQARLWNDAEQLRKQGKRTECREPAARAFALEKTLFGDTSHVLQYLSSYLSCAAEAARDNVTAERLLFETMAIQLRLLRTPRAAEDLHHLQQALDVRRAVLGKDHPWVGLTLLDLALAQEAAGHLDLARASIDQAMPLFKAAGFDQVTLKPMLSDRQMTDAAYHRMRLRLAVETRSEAELLRWVPEEFAQGFKSVQERCTEAERRELAGEIDKARALWREVVTSARRILWDASAAAAVCTELEMARQMRPIFDRYLAFAARTRLTDQEATAAYFTLINLKGAVFIHQRRIWLERRHPWLRPFFESLDDVNHQLATLAQRDQEDRLPGDQVKRLRALLVRKLALEAELGRRHDKIALKFQPAPPSVQLHAGEVLVDYLAYEGGSLPREGTAPAERRLACFVSRRNLPVVFLDLGPLEPITDAVWQWRGAIQRGGGRSERGMVRRLTDPEEPGGDPQRTLRHLLWEPLLPYLKGATTVLISPDDVLCAAPFAALPGSRPGTYLLEEMPLAVVPTPLLMTPLKSMTEFLAQRDAPLFSSGPRPPLESGPLLVGDVDFAACVKDWGAQPPRPEARPQRFAPLPGTGQEIAAIDELFRKLHPEERSCRLTGRRATKDAVRQELIRHQYVHLATHGYFSRGQASADGDQPELRSALALAGADSPLASEAGAGILTALEVESLDLSGTDLAVLSACETGLGEVQKGEGVLGLQRAFQCAGVRTTITSLWQVHDEATQALMVAFYQNLWAKPSLTPCDALRKSYRGRPDSRQATEKCWRPLEALRQAQLAMLRGELYQPPGNNNGPTELKQPARLPPRYWAAFTLSGDWTGAR